MKKIWHENGLSITLLIITLITMVGHAVTGWISYNSHLQDFNQAPLELLGYLQTGNFIETFFENWESEFLQMGMYIVLTVFLYQKGSSESKDPDKLGEEEVDREPSANRPGAPAAVRKGGWQLKIYQNSLSLAFLALFCASYFLHAYGAAQEHNEEQLLKGKSDFTDMWKIMGQSHFWFQSFQNWQSEFLSVLAIVFLSIRLRQKGSPESKPVDAAHNETGTA